MTGISRRTAIKTALLGGAAAMGGRSAAAAASAGAPLAPPLDAVGLLYDSTLCIGCKACVVACKEAGHLPADTAGDRLYDRPDDLNSRTRNIIKLYRDGQDTAFVKRQCMHCVDPACVAACMLGALKKRELGIVSYDVTYCVGCRYCEVACPFGVPKFQWTSNTPRIVKCELCQERLAAGQEPACTEVCPRHAVIFGRRTELLKEAKRRLAETPGRYVPKVYGETDGGGTQVLYLSHVPFEKLGLPALGDEPAPQLARSIQHGVYKGFVAPLALYGVLGMIAFRNRTHAAAEGDQRAGGK